MQVFNKTGVCSGCGKPRLIVNAKYCLCAFCNRDRLTATKPPKPVKTLKKAVKPIKPKPREKPNPKSEKKKAREEALSETKAFIIATRPAICSGCNRSGNLSFSHVIAVSNSEDLEAVPRNIVWDCLTVGRVNPVGKNKTDLRGCHDIWEHGTKEDRQRLLNYSERLEIIKELKPDYYNLLILKDRI